MFDISLLREKKHVIVILGSHPGIVQAMLDYEYLLGKETPSVVAIVNAGRKFEKYFYGRKEILIPCYATGVDIPQLIRDSITLFLNVMSARRVLRSCKEALDTFPQLVCGVVFAENTPEKHSLELYDYAKTKQKYLIGPSSIGVILPGVLKLGAIGGVDYRQFAPSKLFSKGRVAVLSSSGGMTNEIIRIVAQSRQGLSFSLSFGGDRFPLLTPEDAFLAAQADPETESIVYAGELGGDDEYVLADLLRSQKITKKVICNVAGSIGEMFDTPMQFGHAKALAQKRLETAQAKREALRESGARVSERFEEFVQLIQEITSNTTEIIHEDVVTRRSEDLKTRKKSLFTSSISRDVNEQVSLLGRDQLEWAKESSFAAIALSMFLGKSVQSKEFIQLVDFIFKLLVDNGPYVSGAINTIVAARADKDLVSSLTSGLLTIGPRFGGAVNTAAGNWLKGVRENTKAFDFVEDFAVRREHILGIGHKKYRSDFPDPRVSALMEFAHPLNEKKFLSFAREVESITLQKKGNLILNVDGLMAALLLDYLSEKEGYGFDQLQDLVRLEFFNAFFILPRSVGFMAHYFDQKRLGEGLFRLNSDDVSYLSNT